jgi:2-methylcitrate dehydratase PrpD
VTLGPTHALASFALEAEFDDAARAQAVRAVLDTLAATVAGLTAPDAQSVVEFVRADRAAGPSTALGLPRPVSAASAALVNGTIGHLADYDDVSHPMMGHPSGVLVPVLLAVAEQHQSSGRAVLDAYWAGLRVALAIAAGFDVPAHYRRGWHSTGTVGPLAATAAVARLRGLEVEAARRALGLAASFAAGSRQNFGTTTKALHVGRAAELAITAVELVAAGATADPDQLEGPLGYFALFGGAPVDAAAVSRALDKTPDTNVTVKMYPCCFQSHRAVDAALAVHQEIGGAPLAAVEVTVQPGGAAALIHDRPTTPLEAKFSGPYIVATAVSSGRVGLADFTESAVWAPARRALLERVTLRETDRPAIGPASWEGGFAVVDATLTDGRHVRSRCDAPRGHPRNPPTTADVQAKFADCLSYAGLHGIVGASSEAITALAADGPADVVLPLINETLLAARRVSRA